MDIADIRIVREIHFSVSLKTKTAIEVEKAITVIFNLEGFPKRIQTDNGKEFVNALIINYLAENNISFVGGKPRHPQNQGQVEQVNQTLSGSYLLN